MRVQSQDRCWIEKALVTIKNTFYRSAAPESIKELVRNIEPVISFNNGIYQWWAQAYCKVKVGNDRYLRRHERQNGTIPYLLVTKTRKMYSVIVLTGSMHKVEYSFLKEILAHEFAHIVDNHMRGDRFGDMWVVSSWESHDENWQKLCHWFGSSGRISYRHNEKTKKHFGKSPKYHKVHTCWQNY